MDYILDESSVQQENFIFAGFGKRLVALILDSIILYFVNWIFLGLILGLMPTQFVAGANFDYFSYFSSVMNYTLLSYGIHWLYSALMESSSYQGTIGKVVLGIVVVDEISGGRISFGKATGRYFGKILSSLILGIGYLMMLWSQKSQTLHDKLSGCVVVVKPRF